MINPRNLTVDSRGVVKNRKTGAVVTIIYDPTPKTIRRFRRRMWRLYFKTEFRACAKAAARAVSITNNRGGNSPSDF